MRPDVDLQRTLAMETFATVATSVPIMPVVMTTRDASDVTATLIRCQQIHNSTHVCCDQQLCKFQ